MYLPREEGQGLVEYALILVLVAVVVIAILTLLGPQIANTFSKITNGLSTRNLQHQPCKPGTYHCNTPDPDLTEC